MLPPHHQPPSLGHQRSVNHMQDQEVKQQQQQQQQADNYIKKMEAELRNTEQVTLTTTGLLAVQHKGKSRKQPPEVDTPERTR